MKRQAIWGIGLALVGAALLVVVTVFLPTTPKQTEPTAPTGPGVTTPPAEPPGGVSATLPPPPPVAVPPPATPEPSAPPPPPAIPPAATGPAPTPAPAPPQEPAPTPRPQAQTPVRPEKEYGVWLGSYRRYRDAQKLRDKLQRQGMPAYVLKKQGKKPYEVWAGPFGSKIEAERLAKQVKKKFKKSGTVRGMAKLPDK